MSGPVQAWRIIVLGVVLCSTGVRLRADLLPPMVGYASDYASRRAGASVDASIKLSVSEGGLHRVTGADLVSAGVPPSTLMGAQMRLFCRTWETAIHVSTDGLFADDDYLLFWAEPYESTYTRTSVYWLGFGPGGLRMHRRDASPLQGAALVREYRHLTRYAPELMFFDNFQPNDATFDHWFAGFMSKTYNENNEAVLWTDHLRSDETVHLDLSLRGGDSYPGSPDHRTTVKVNGVEVGSVLFDERDVCESRVSFSGDKLTSPTTTITLNQTQTNANDRAYLQSLEIEFARWLRSADRRTQEFVGSTGACNYAVSHFETNDWFWVADVSDARAPVLLDGYAVTNDAGRYTVTFGDTTTVARAYSIAEASGLRMVDSIERVAFRNLATTGHQADYIVICPYAFRTSAYRLLKHRHLDGLRVIVSPIEDIYNEFSYGIADAAAIKQFLGYAYFHWEAPEPRYVLLAGEGTYDPKGNLGATGEHVLPVHMGASSWRWSAMDNWFVQVSGVGDQLIDMAIGRIPVTTDAALGDVIDKILAFEQGVTGEAGWTGKAILVADADDPPHYFGTVSDSKVATHLSGYALQKAYLGAPYTPSQVRTVVLNGFNSGIWFMSYFGHGARNVWSNYDVWNSTDVVGLGNTTYPLVAMFTCETGSFQDRGQECMAELHLERAGAGAVACLAPSILGGRLYSEYVADGFTETLVGPGRVRLGDAMIAGMTELFVNGNPFREELRAYHILGDPATVVKVE